eukprot:CAMPEP_0194370310 /NCGR_PEP_ID=MMETSP0174-20130528/18581_1 /TAXON_ID=216777 /ORGANISM="Proboscia alata, Strain PI-D3" /LENGTH=59 /DNA_ID=CAMNT_0039147669 /DNA_START=64 /DNA_END=239 /DNA_ORIENTATION=+
MRVSQVILVALFLNEANAGVVRRRGLRRAGGDEDKITESLNQERKRNLKEGKGGKGSNG